MPALASAVAYNGSALEIGKLQRLFEPRQGLVVAARNQAAHAEVVQRVQPPIPVGARRCDAGQERLGVGPSSALQVHLTSQQIDVDERFGVGGHAACVLGGPQRAW